MRLGRLCTGCNLHPPKRARTKNGSRLFRCAEFSKDRQNQSRAIFHGTPSETINLEIPNKGPDPDFF